MGRRHNLLATAILVAASTTWAGERPTVENLLNTCQSSFEKLSRVRIECTAKIPERKQATAGVKELTTNLTILRDASRWKVDQIESGMYLIKGKLVPHQSWAQILVRDEMVRAQLFAPPPQDPQVRPVVVAYRDTHTYRLWTMISLACFTFGYMEGDGGLPLWTVMGEDTNLELLSEPEKIAGVETWVLKSRGKYGDHKVWFDPASGGLPRRIEYRKGPGNLLSDEQIGSRAAENPRLPASLQEIFIRIDNIQIENHGGVFVIAGFDYDSRGITMKEQQEQIFHREFKTRAIEIAPKPWPEEAFQFDIKIPNGTIVGVFNNVPLSGGGGTVSYEEWIDGKLHPRPGQ